MRLPVFGIDPGVTGALTTIDRAGVVRFYDTPTIEIHGGTKAKPKKKTVYDYAAMAAIVRAMVVELPGVRGVLEKVHSMPKQGVASSFSFGEGSGMWKGILASFLVPHELVDPRRWTGLLLKDLPKGDEAAVVRCGQLYAEVAPHLRSPRGRLLLGRADSLLLAHYGATVA